MLSRWSWLLPLTLSCCRQQGSSDQVGHIASLARWACAPQHFNFQLDAANLPPLPCSALQRLHIRGATITPRSFEAFRRLPGLTALHLRDCQLEGLPAGPYLSGLRR